jgi:general secretion pathway protein D
MTERHFFCKRQRQVLFSVLVGLCLLCSGPLLASDQGASSSEAHHRFFPLINISPERGRELLSKLGLGTASKMPGTNALLVTAGADDLKKAGIVLALVDAPEAFEICQIAPASMVSSMPSNERIASAVGNIRIGTFSRPPSEIGKARALVDVHNGSVWAIAPRFQLQDIKLAVELGPQVLEQRRAKAEPRVAGATRPSFDTQNGQANSGKITVSGEMQRKVLETQLQAVDHELPGLGTAGLGVLPPRPLETERKPLAFDLALAQTDTSVPVSPNEPSNGSGERASLLPGQIVPDPAEDALTVAEVEGPDASEMVTEPMAATNAYEPIRLLTDDRVIELALPEKLPVIQLLDLVGKYMKLDYIYDPAKISGEVTLKLNGDLRGSMKVKDLYLLLESVLKFQNLAMTRRGNMVTIVPAADVLSVDPRLVGPGESAVEAGDVVVTRVFDLEHIDATSAQNLLESMKLSVEVTPIVESSTLIVTAYAHRMARVEQLLEMVDKPGEPRKFRFRQLRYTMAKNLAEKVKNLAEQLEGVSVTVGSGGGSSPTSVLKKMAGESDAAYRQRQARARAQAAARARAATARKPEEETTKPGVYLDADERTNRILMIGVQEQLDVVDDLIDALDVEQQDLRSMKLHHIKHVDAEEVSRKLQELGIITKVPDMSASSRITGGSRTQSATAAAQARAAAAVAARVAATDEASEEGPVEQPQVVVVESTNSLLVNATAEQHAQIEIIIGYVDSETLEDEIPYKIYPLENSSPDHLATILQSLIQETTQNEDQEGKIIESVIQKREEEITIVPDPNTYSLIVYASKKNQVWISNLVKQLDKRRPQVLIDVTLVEITETDAFTYDLNIIQSIPNLASTSGLTGAIVEGISSDTIMGKLATSDRSQFADAQWDGDRFTAFYGDRHINALLTAMKSKNYGRVLAKPKILVNDNEPGTIKTTDTTYIEKTSSIPVSSGGAGTDTTLIQTATDYTPYDAGITLDITPHISEGDLLRLDISLVRSDFLATEDTSKPPNTTSSEITTAVTVPDGSTVILGGLVKLNQNKGGKKVPILGDLPLVGGLFRSVNNEDRQSKLYVFVKAEVIRPEQGLARGLEDLERLSERNRLAFEQHEMEFQNYQSWPGVKAKPVAPEKVLEAQ